VLVVTPKKIAEAFFREHHLDTLTNLTFVSVSEELKSRFNITTVPYYVWVGKQQRVQAITALEYTNQTEFSRVLAGEDISHWPDISVERAAYILDTSLIDNTGRRKTYLSIMDGYREGRKDVSHFSISAQRNFAYWRLTNLPPKLLYERAAGFFIENFTRTRLLLYVKDPGRFYYDRNRGDYWNNWIRNNCITYEAVLPVADSNRRFEKLRQDLDYYLQMTSAIAEIDSSCWILADLPQAPKSTEIVGDSTGVPHYSVADLIRSVSYITEYGLAISEAHRPFPYRVTLSGETLNDPSRLAAVLEKLGYSFKKGRRKLSFFVVTDKKNEPLLR